MVIPNELFRKIFIFVKTLVLFLEESGLKPNTVSLLLFQGIMHNTKPVFTAQFHPEAKGGPTDTEVP